MPNVITKESDKLVLYGFKALSHNAVMKYGNGILIIGSRPYKQSLKDQIEVKVEEDRTIVDDRALVVAKYLLEHKNSLFMAYHLKWSEKTTMRIGGWSTPDVVNRIYTHLAEQDLNDDIRRMKEFYSKT